jgi:hypothetical protein
MIPHTQVKQTCTLTFDKLEKKVRGHRNTDSIQISIAKYTKIIISISQLFHQELALFISYGLSINRTWS